MRGEIKLGIRSQLSHANRNPVAQEVLLKPKLIHPDRREARNIADRKDVTHMLGRDILTAKPIPPCGKASSSPSKQLLEVNVSLKAHQAGINRPTAHAARRVTPNFSHILRIEGDSFVRSSGSKAAQFRADSDEFMLVIAVLPIASLTVPVAVMMMMPVFIIPVVISTVLVRKGCQRSATY
jgi:hypothetical protein